MYIRSTKKINTFKMSKSCSACDKKNKCGVTLFNFQKKDTQRSKWIEFVNKPYWLPNVRMKKIIHCVVI